MNHLILMTLQITLLCACSVNQQSREHYQASKIRHGIIPITADGPKSQLQAGPLDPRAVKRGQQVYEKHCISCHGDLGYGDGPMADLQEHAPVNLRQIVKEVPDFKFFVSISQYVGNMPGWVANLSEQDIRDVSQYLRSLD